jgi:hypothetical protein
MWRTENIEQQLHLPSTVPTQDMIPQTMAPSQLTFTRLHASFGAECDGLDFSRVVTSESIEAIRAGLVKLNSTMRDT